MLTRNVLPGPARRALLAGCGLWLCGFAPAALPALPAGYSITLKVLVIGPTDDPKTAVNEGVYLEAATAILKRVGIPYDLAAYPAGGDLANLPVLEDVTANRGYYQGIIFAASDFRMNPYYPATWAGQTADAKRLEAYTFKYDVRVASFYASSNQTGCLGPYPPPAGVSAGATPANALLTTAGSTLMPYLKAGTSAANPLPLKNTFIYTTPALPAAGASGAGPNTGVDVLPAGTTVTPLITYNRGPIASLCQFTEADPPVGQTARTRQLLALTFANAAYLNHSIALSYGMVDWLTKGIHLGQRHVYLDPQSDDLFLPDNEYPYTMLNDETMTDFREYTKYLLGLVPGYPTVTCTITDPSTGSPCEYRITGAEFNSLINWQNRLRGNGWGGAKTVNKRLLNTANAGGPDGIRISHAYNGGLASLPVAYQPCGTFCMDAWPNDTLTPAVNNKSNEFKWINHTFDHQSLGDPITLWPDMLFTTSGTGCPNTVLDAYTELCWNHTVRTVLGLTRYDKSALVTPEYSGLYNRDFLEAAALHGTQYLAMDISRPTPPVGSTGCLPANGAVPGPNSGKFNCEAYTSGLIAGKQIDGTPRMLFEVPRWPVALFYLVTTPDEWTSLFNFFYGKNGVMAAPAVAPFVDTSGQRRDMSYAEVVEYVSDTLLGYLLSYDIRPLMFHQANLRQVGSSCLLCDLLNETVTKYNLWYQKLPIRSPNLKYEGDQMKQRMVYDAMAPTGVLRIGANGVTTLDLAADATRASTVGGLKATDAQTVAGTVVIPVTGVACLSTANPACGSTAGTGMSSNPETYGSGTAAKVISYIKLTSGNGYQVTGIPGPAW